MTTSNHDKSQYSPSALSLYRECSTKYRYERLLKLVPRNSYVSHDLRFGVAAHKSLSLLYSGASFKDVGNAFMDAYPVSEYPDPLPITAQGKSQSNFLAALWDYIKVQYPQDREQWEIVELEEPQTGDEGGDYEHMLVPDMIVRDRSDGLTYLVDFKTTGKYINDIWGRFEMSSQVRTYTDHVKQRFGSCGGFIVQAFALRNRSKPVTPRSGPDKGVYLPAGDWYKYGRMTYAPSEECLEMERANIRATVHQINHSLTSGEWTYNAGQCRAGTPWECTYYSLCKHGYTWERDAELILDTYRQACRRQIDGESRCNREVGHDGECSEHDTGDEREQIIVVPEDDPYYSAICD